MPSAADNLFEAQDLECFSQALTERQADRSLRRAMSPRLSYGRQFGPIPSGSRQAAVVMLLYPHEGQIWIPLTVRPETLPQHAGQICLPGGLIEPGETSQQAALRELEEELGVHDDLQIVGKLSELYVFVSGFRVEPWIVVRRSRPPLIPQDAEVAEVLEMPLSHLADRVNHQRYELRRGPLGFSAPCFDWRGQQIWGATSMILAELIGVLEEHQPSWISSR